MQAETVARGIAINRTLIGTALALAPEQASRGWIGSDSKIPGAQLMTRGFGARDLAIGIGTLWALNQQAARRPWVSAGLISDAMDLVATLAVRESLPWSGRVVAAGMAGGSALLDAWLLLELD